MVEGWGGGGREWVCGDNPNAHLKQELPVAASL